MLIPWAPRRAASTEMLNCRKHLSFHPEMVFFANLGVNLRGCLCGSELETC
ncbi:MAG: hypothetical protein ACQET7_04405 [Thermodesulfobacteriota bacterium]